MFDVGFSEIVVIMVVALVVIGPKRLPAVARSMGQWWGRLQRYINRMKMDVTASMELEDLRELERKVKAEAEALERSVQQAGNDLDHEMRQLEKKLEHSTRDLRKANPHVVPTLSIKQP
ncbi:MAG: Sec-independent protein translocase protein TatB [Sideroxydans sp.]